MKFLLLVLVLLCSFTTSFSQDIYFDWAKQLDRRTGLSFEEGYYIGVDANKNVYLAGNYRNTMDLDPGANEYNVSGYWDQMFIIKFDPAGNFIWGKSIGGDRFTLCRDFEVDLAGNIYATGKFGGTTDFDPGPAKYELTAIPTVGTENYDIFTIKLDTDGNLSWAARAGDLDQDMGNSIAIDNSGNVFTTGRYVGTVDFDPGAAVFNLGNDGVSNTFITKFDKDGNFIWAKNFSGNFSGYGSCIETDDVGNIYVSGTYEGTVDFDPGPRTQYLTSDFYSRTPFISKLDASGNLIWVKENQGGGAFKVNSQQQVVTISSMAGGQGVITKYDVNGNVVWSKITGGRPASSHLSSSPIRLDEADNIYLTGEFHSTQDFDPGPGIYNMSADGLTSNDAFICRLNANGDLVWAKRFGNYIEENAMSIAIDTAGDVYTSGIYVATVDFDPGPGVFELASFSGGGIYIHKMSRCKNVTYASINATACNSYTLNGETYTQSGTYLQTRPNSSGCDSIITLNLALQSKITSMTATVCDVYLWNDRVITASGIYFDTLTTTEGCDSLVRLDLVIMRKSTTTIDRTICEGGQFEGYSANGTYTDRFIAANGCDSIRTLNLTITPKKIATITLDLCEGQRYEGYTKAGIYVDTLISVQGCDSIRTLHLKINPSYSFTVSKSICKGETYMSHSLPGTYTDLLHSISGCDSIQTTVLTVLDPPDTKLGADTTICIGDSIILLAGKAESYVWQDGSSKDHFVVKSPGLYFVNATNICGSKTDNILVTENSCTIYFPTAFTPNDDGTNDRFGILNGYNVRDFQLTIYNRFGQVVFESKRPEYKWDGSYKGKAQQTEVFVWRCVFRENNSRRNMKGTVLLIR